MKQFLQATIPTKVAQVYRPLSQVASDSLDQVLDKTEADPATELSPHLPSEPQQAIAHLNRSRRTQSYTFVSVHNTNDVVDLRVKVRSHYYVRRRVTACCAW